MDRKIKICLVGCGGMAASYRHRYTQIPGAFLGLVIDASEDVAREAAQKLGVEKWSTIFEDALASDIDIVDISTPNFLHEQQAVAALNAGKHVLLQKPIAPTLEEARNIVDAGYRNGKQIGMYMSMLDNPVYHEIKSLIKQGLLGRISSIHCRGAHRGGLNMPADNWRNSLKKTGGGSFIQLAVHPVNMVQYLLEDRISKVFAFSKNMMCPNVGGDDVTAVSCEFESGILGTLESAYCAQQDILSIYGSKGFISVFSDKQIQIMLDDIYESELIKYHNPGEVESVMTELDMRVLYKKENPYDQHIAFVEAIMKGKTAPVPAETGLYDLKIVKAVYKSAIEQKLVEVDAL